nr:Gfo/Idh/MocA family oxidoreductase [Paenibacillus xylanexedens]
MNVLVVGYGSIGQRHTRILKGMGYAVSVVSRRSIQSEESYGSLTQAFGVKKFQYIIIATETSDHLRSLKELTENNFDGFVLVEKPLFSKYESVEVNKEKVFVAYNLRFHPLIMKSMEFIKNDKVISVNAYVGQYLPSWRPDTDYKKSYSAFNNKGGGVLRDLSHELDYLTFLFGEWDNIAAVTGKISELNIHSEDYAHFFYKSIKDIYISVELNYIDRIHQRYIIIQTDSQTLKIDFIKNSINCNGSVSMLDKIDSDYTYREQHKAVLNNSERCCSYEEGLKIVKMIESIEESALNKEWIHHE